MKFNTNNRKRYNNSSGYTGVTAMPYGKWRARIKIFGQDTHVGHYATEQEASAAYQQALQNHKEQCNQQQKTESVQFQTTQA